MWNYSRRSELNFSPLLYGINLAGQVLINVLLWPQCNNIFTSVLVCVIKERFKLNNYILNNRNAHEFPGLLWEQLF